MKTIYITGFMGSGKTTVGQAISQHLNLPVFDTDTYIEKKMDKSVKEIFRDQGENFFRQEESSALKELPLENAIVTTGGGIIKSKENRQWMKQHGIIVFLYADITEVMKRLEGDITRPLILDKSMEEVKALFQNRLPFYKEAHYTVNTNGKKIEEIVTEIERMIKKGSEG